jgi:hypothetical protein
MTFSFAEFLSDPRIKQAVVPMIQRDYAHGRPDPDASRIREDIVASLCAAATGGNALTLDFVYGTLSGGVFLPLDGQQRLTTLFLLHCYLAARAGIPVDGDDGPRGFLRKFGYEVRASAREFCDKLASLAELPSSDPLSAALADEPWFVPAWHHDATVVGMLTVLDVLHRHLAKADARDAWCRLTEADSSAIRFHQLPLPDVGPGEVLYVRMNSRGKPLTTFENFKADLLERVKRARPGREHELGQKLDGVWSDAFWAYATDHVVDKALLAYLNFVTDVVARTSGVVRDPIRHAALIDWVGAVFCQTNPEERLLALSGAFDAWSNPARTGRAYFDAHFATGVHVAGKLTLFRPGTHDLLQACRDSYRSHPAVGTEYQQNRDFGLLDECLLHAITVERTAPTGEFPRRIRQLRNLGEATDLKATDMAAALRVAARIVKEGLPDDPRPFTARQLDEERRKSDLSLASPHLIPALHRLEDHPLCKGTVAAFRLDDTLPEAVDAFYAAFPPDSNLNKCPAANPRLHLALLAMGEYEWWRGPVRRIVDGSRESWFDFLHRGQREEMEPLLRSLAGGNTPEGVIAAFLMEKEAAQQLHWRYYVIKYDAMRSRGSGRYQFANGGFDVRQLAYTTTSAEKEDAYLSAVRAAVPELAAELSPWGYWSWQLDQRALEYAPFAERWLTHLPTRQHLRFRVDAVVLRDGRHTNGGDGASDTVVSVAQSPDGAFDHVDRVGLAATLLRRRVADCGVGTQQRESP